MDLNQELKKSFVLLTKYEPLFQKLNATGRSELIMGLFAYVARGEMLHTDDPAVDMAFTIIKEDLDFYLERYERRCEQNRANGKLGGRPRKPNGTDSKQEKPNGFGKSLTDTETKTKTKAESYGGSMKASAKFQKPTVEDVRAYCEDRHNSVDPEAFVNFYESKGWKVGDQPMKDWKACVRTWERSESRRTYSKPDDRKGQSRGTDYDAMIAQGICAEYAPVAQRVS